MGAKVREKPKESGEWWVFITNRGRHRALKAGEQKQARQIAGNITARINLG